MWNFLRSRRTPRPRRTVQAVRFESANAILEERTLMTGGMLDLTTVAAQATANGAVFRQMDQQPTGTGVIDSFVRVQTPNGKTTTESGYNTDARPLQLDENSSPQFTRHIQVKDVPVVQLNGVRFREFLLDVNQQNNKPNVSLDQLKLYVGAAGNLSGYNPVTGQLAGLSPVYDLDANGADYWVKLNASLNSGSGSGDMYFYVPDSVFAGAGANGYVYLYSQFGTNASANGGFEEWAVRKGVPEPPPPPAPTGLSGRVYLDVDQNGVFNAGDTGIGGVEIRLVTYDPLTGENMFITQTDEFGQYNFPDVAPGVYNLYEVQPLTYDEGTVNPGSLGGDVEQNAILNINVLAGLAGIDYNFGELYNGGGGPE